MNYLLLWIILNNILIYFVIAKTNEIRMVQAIWRHGDRAPSGLPYPNDKYDEKSWPRGWNQLTNKGIWQSVQLGIWLRRKYGNVIGREFNKDRVFIRSSDSERAIETAQGVAAGIFPPTGSRIWESSFLKYWQPTPIHTNGNQPDPLLRPSKVKCPEYNRLVDESNKKLASVYNIEYQDLFEILTEKTGQNVSYPDVGHLYDIQREIENGLRQDDWVTDLYNGSTIIDHIKEFKRISRMEDFNTPEKAKITGGFLANKLASNIKQYQNGTSKLNAILYSAHDGTLSGLLFALNISNMKLVPYAACIILELYANDTIRILYKTSPAEPSVLKLPECEEYCSVDKFVELVDKVSVKSLQELYEICKTPGEQRQLVNCNPDKGFS